MPPLTSTLAQPLAGSQAAGLSWRLLALVLLGLVGLGVWDYPVIGWWLPLLLAGYGAVLLIYPGSWLLILPALLPVLDLAPWSGRLLWSEFDLFVLLTVSAGLWQGYYSPLGWRHYPLMLRRVIVLLILAHGIALVIGLWPPEPWNPTALASYLSQYNALRIGRGPVWALLLVPLLDKALRRDRQTALLSFYLGMALGLSGLGLIALWERGVFDDMLKASNLYQFAGSLLDFTWRYRITGLFSQMHTGGSAIDGYIALAWPFGLGLLLVANRRPLLIVGAIVALSLGTYAAMTTFTRITYAACAVAFLTFLFGLALLQRNKLAGWRMAVLAGSLAVTITLAAVAFSYGGMQALLGGLIALAGAIVLGYLSLDPWHKAGGLFIFGCGACYLMAEAMLTSRWNPQPEAVALPLGLGLAAALVGLGALAGRQLAHARAPLSGTVGGALLLTLALAITVPAALGAQMGARFATVGKDQQTRLQHWSDVLNARTESWWSYGFGMGLGAFPRHYLLAQPGERNVGTYAIVDRDDQPFLRLGVGKDLEVGQRAPIRPNSRYTVVATLRADSMSFLRVRLCNRNLLHAAYCSYATVSAQPGQWATIAVPMQSGRVGEGFWLTRWPAGVFISNRQDEGVIELAGLRLLDASGNNILQNSDFSAGLDHWFTYNEFEHLPWHAKSLGLHIFFEQGLLGLMAFLLLWLYAMHAAFQQIRRGDIAAVPLASALAGFMVAGITGSLIDAPRTAFLFYLLALTPPLLTSLPHSMPPQRGSVHR